MSDSQGHGGPSSAHPNQPHPEGRVPAGPSPTPAAEAEESHQSAPAPQPSAAETADAESGVHPGWGAQPQTSYESASSGGWGTPGHAESGPLRLNVPSEQQARATSTPQSGSAPAAPAAPKPGEAASPYGQQAAPMGGYQQSSYPQQAGYAAPGSYPQQSSYQPPQFGGYPQQGVPGAPTGAQTAPGAQPGGQQWGWHESPQFGTPSAPAHHDGFGAMLDFSFSSRATRALAPVLFWVVVMWAVIDIITALQHLLNTAPYSAPTAILATMFISAIFWGVVKVTVARLFLELCVNLTDMAAALKDSDSQ
ncbi:hypothetical protein KEM60_00208 [Austwickia sp. TVS 96-490-7B]|uniref:DUF4282 domain-containing protein n=1 Tax=Austwickia sp. TVS 96-490-7B TaxID=2830843 RepID=UPI001C57FDEF|nr:DUF4282 domain-containing protein [Austwickia sp. TVS 96-490-7B]MBW3084025.1 hypothetical protein [Austwickia sp. TVS 96-490-7B]